MHFKILNFRSVIAAVFIFLSPIVLSNTYDQLVELDKIKTQNFELFSSRLDEVRATEAASSDNEKHYLAFLVLYRQIYLQGYEKVTVELERLLEYPLQKNLRLRVLAVAVNASLVNRDYKKSFLYADELLTEIDDVDDEFTLRQVLAPVAYLFIDARQPDVAKFFIDSLRKIPTENNAICFADYLEFRMYFLLGQGEEIQQAGDRALESCQRAGEQLWESFTAIQLTMTYLSNSEYEKSHSLLDIYRDYSTGSSYPVLSGLSFAVDAELALTKKEFAKAHKLLSLALKRVEQNDLQELAMYVNKVAYKVYFAEGKYREALNYYKVYKELESLLDKDRADKQLSYQQVKSEVEVKNQRIELLNKDNELLFLQNSVVVEEVRQTRVMIAVLAVVLSIAMYLAYKGLTGRHRFKKIAEFDQLTGISNRYHFNNQAELALEFCRKNNQPAAVILFDLDHFKSINDNHGHAVGDWALQAVVGTCRHFMRNNDVFGRIGGEEFAVVLPGCQTDKAALLAEICRDAIAAIDTEDSGTTFPLTASFGVSGSDSSGYQLKQLLADADKAMYRAKDGGRDQVVSFAEA